MSLAECEGLQGVGGDNVYSLSRVTKNDPLVNFKILIAKEWDIEMWH